MAVTACNQLHRFTESYAMKRSTTNKKRAYEQVFGEELGAKGVLSRELCTADLGDIKYALSKFSNKRLNRRDMKLAKRERLN